jgi:hypothetical protein
VSRDPIHGVLQRSSVSLSPAQCIAPFVVIDRTHRIAPQCPNPVFQLVPEQGFGMPCERGHIGIDLFFERYDFALNGARNLGRLTGLDASLIHRKNKKMDIDGTPR